MSRMAWVMGAALLALLSPSAPVHGQTKDHVLHTFKKIQLTNEFWTEEVGGASSDVSPSADLPMPARGQLYMALGDGVENWRPPDDLANSQ